MLARKCESSPAEVAPQRSKRPWRLGPWLQPREANSMRERLAHFFEMERHGPTFRSARRPDYIRYDVLHNRGKSGDS
jgi:hypothetical protein